MRLFICFACGVLTLIPASGAIEYPDDPYSPPREDVVPVFEQASVSSASGNPYQRALGFDLFEFVKVDTEDGPCTEWRFKGKPDGTLGAGMSATTSIRHCPLRIALTVNNLSPEPVKLVCRLAQGPWSPNPEVKYVDWMMAADGPIAPGEKRTLVYDVEKAAGGLDAVRAAVISRAVVQWYVEGGKPGVEYALRFSKLTIAYPGAAGCAVTAIQPSAPVEAGNACSWTVNATGVKPEAISALEVRQGRRVLWRIRLDAGERRALAGGQAVIKRICPDWLPARDYMVGLVVDGLRVEGPEAPFMVSNARKPGFPKAERRLHNGRPTIFVEGEPFQWSGYASYDWQPGNVAEFGASGANMFVLPVCAGIHIHGVADPSMTAPGVYDFTDLDEKVAMALQANPKARLMMRVSLLLPSFWAQAHPDSLARLHTDRGEIGWEETGTTAITISSEDWRRDQAEALRALIAYCKEQPWADRVISFVPTGEVTEEWFAWGSNDRLLGDYSPDNQTAFGKWLTSAGQTAYPIPEPSVRRPVGCDILPDSEEGARAAAYSEFIGHTTQESLGLFAHVIKETTDNRSLAGAFYGYVMQLSGEPRQSISGHMDMRPLLDNPDFDFFMGIPLLNFRDLTNGYQLGTSATESIIAAGKLFIDENDHFSWLHHNLWHTLYNPDDPRKGAIYMHRRVLGDDMVHGNLRQWFSLAANWHHDDQLHAEFAKLNTLQTSSPAYDRTPVEEVAFCMDNASFDWTAPDSVYSRTCNTSFIYTLGRTGAPVGVWLLSDLAKLPERIKVVVISWAFAARAEDIKAVEDLLAKGGRTVIIVGPVGLVDRAQGRWDRTAPARITGMPIRVDEGSAPGGVHLTGQSQLLGDKAPLNPRCVLEGDGWLAYEDGAVAGGERPLPNGGRLIWCGAPPADSVLLRGWLDTAGVHSYAPINYFVHASREIVSITGPFQQDAAISWPEPVSVTDLIDGWMGEGQTMSCPFEPGQTRIFKVSAGKP